MSEEKRDNEDIKTFLLKQEVVGTGYKYLDKCIGGFPKGKVSLITGERNVGKATFMINVMYNLISKDNNFKIGVFNRKTFLDLTMLKEYFCCIDAGINFFNLRYLSENEKKKVMSYKEKYLKSNLYVSDLLFATAREIYVESMAVAKTMGLEIIFVESIERLCSERKESIEDLRLVTMELKLLAKELNIPVVATIETREQKSKYENTLLSVHRYGRVELDTDLILSLYRSSCEDEELSVFVKLNTTTKVVGMNNLIFDIKKQRIKDIDFVCNESEEQQEDVNFSDEE